MTSFFHFLFRQSREVGHRFAGQNRIRDISPIVRRTAGGDPEDRQGDHLRWHQAVKTHKPICQYFITFDAIYHHKFAAIYTTLLC